MQKDLNYIAALEKAVKEKYGDIATMNPKHFWNEEKEKEYIEQTKKAVVKERTSQESKEKVELEGVLIPKKLINKTSDRQCAVCKAYSFNKKDDVYMNKFVSCYKCYMIYIEGNEERWASGWRPAEINKNG
jgi:hypothetical protein